MEIFTNTFILIFVVVLATKAQMDLQEAGTSESSFFDQLSTSEFFVDKTLFIRYYLETEDPFVVYLAPRRFGKSTLMKTLKLFLEFRLHQNGSAITDTSTLPNPFLKTKIYTTRRNLFNEHFARYPVIYLNFNKLDFNDFRTFSRSFAAMIRNEFWRHKYLLKDEEAVKGIDARNFTQFNQSEIVLTLDYYVPAIKNLSQCLKIHFKKPAILIIDNHDSFRRAITMPHFKARTDELSTLLGTIGKFVDSLVKGNHKNINRAVFTGITRLGYVSDIYSLALSHANNLLVKHIYESPRIARYFGVTSKEILTLAKKGNREHLLATAKDWYEGYRVKGAQYKLYNSQSVIEFFKTQVAGKYWDKGYNLTLFRRLLSCPEYRKCVSYLLQGNLTSPTRECFRVKPRVTPNDDADLWGLEGITPSSLVLWVDREDFLLQFLTENGYFTIVERQDPIATIQVPNDEVRMILREMMRGGEQNPWNPIKNFMKYSR